MSSIDLTEEPGGGEGWDEFFGRAAEESFDRFLRGGKVRVRYKNWRITLDTVAIAAGEACVTVTRMKAPYINLDGFRFRAHSKDFLSALWKFCGARSVEVGRPALDRAFVFHSEDERKVRELFSGPEVERLMLAQPAVNLEVRDDEGVLGVEFPEGVDELCFREAGFINDPERLKLLFQLFAAVLDRLRRMGSACEGAPGLSL